MGRKLTEEERLFYEKRHQEMLESSAAKMGLTPEELLEVEKKARAKLVYESKEDTLVLTETEEEFQSFVDDLCAKLNEEFSRRELRKSAKKRRENWTEDSTMSLREEIELTFNSLLKAEQYYNNR